MKTFLDKLKGFAQEALDAGAESFETAKLLEITLLNGKELFGNVGEIGEDFLVLRSDVTNGGFKECCIRFDQVATFDKLNDWSKSAD